MNKLSLIGSALFAAGTSLVLTGMSSAQTAAPSCAWNKYLYAQDAVQQGKINDNPLNTMSALVAKQGYSVTNKVWQLCNGWLMEAKRVTARPRSFMSSQRPKRSSMSTSPLEILQSVLS